jgi:hypothetical protein
MNLLSLLGEITPTVTPSTAVTAAATATATATARATATPTPTPVWETLLSTFLVIALIAVVLALGVLIWRVAQSGNIGAIMQKVFDHFTDMLAYWVVILAFVGIFVLAWRVLRFGADADTNHAVALDTAKYVFGAILPLLGTWVGAVLAHYFQTTTTQNLVDLAKTASNPGKLASLAVKDFMIVPSKVITLPPDLQGKQDSEIFLKQIIDHLKSVKLDRLPLFTGNKDTGVVEKVVHLSKIEKYLADEAVKAPGQDLTTRKLSDLILDAAGKVAPAFKNFTFVKGSATLAEAKTAMDSMTNTPGVDGNCYDVFVTATGACSEPVIGWITNDIINENAKV